MSRLLLEIERGDCKPFEVECDSEGALHDVKPGSRMYPHIRYNKCKRCGNTPDEGRGTRTVRLVGKVEIEVDDTHLGSIYNAQLGWTTPVIMTEWIIRHHKAGTLPAELYQSETNPDGLHEEDCDGQ